MCIHYEDKIRRITKQLKFINIFFILPAHVQELYTHIHVLGYVHVAWEWDPLSTEICRKSPVFAFFSSILTVDFVEMKIDLAFDLG